MPAGCYRRRSEFAFGAHNRDDAGIAARQSCSTSRREALLEISRMRETWQKRRNQLRAKPSRHHEHYLRLATHPAAHLKRPEMPATAAHPIRSGDTGQSRIITNFLRPRGMPDTARWTLRQALRALSCGDGALIG